MALTGRTVVTVTAYNNLVFEWSAVQDAVLGQSAVNWKLLLESGAYGRIDATFGSPWAVTVDGQEFSGKTSIAVSNNAVKVLAEGTVILEHEEDGTKSFTFTFSQALRITFAGEYIDTVTGEGSGVLDPMDPDAAPLLSADSVYLGETVTVTPQGPAGAVYRLEYSLLESGVIGEAVTGPVEWTVPESLGSQFPNVDAALVRILSTAYVDGVRRGKTREATLTVRVPEAAVPQITELSWTDVSPAAALGKLVQNVSRLELDVAYQGTFGSNVMALAVYLGEKEYHGGPLDQSGQVPLTVCVLDSRGRVGTRTEILEVNAYKPPAVWVTAHRCKEDGTDDDTGGWAKVKVGTEWSAFEGNSATVVLTAGEFREEWAAGDRTLLLEAPTEDTLVIQAEISDALGVGRGETTLSTAYCTLDLLYGGRGIAFGATAVKEGFHCAMDAEFTGRVVLADGSELLERIRKIEEQLTVDS